MVMTLMSLPKNASFMIIAKQLPNEWKKMNQNGAQQQTIYPSSWLIKKKNKKKKTE